MTVPRIGCVSFLNSKPLIDGMEGRPGVEVRFDVPSGLLADLEQGRVDIALCPVIDYQRSGRELELVPVGGIGCHGPTLTVRLFSRVPWEKVTQVHADTDSHTSVGLMRVVLAERYGIRPSIVEHMVRARDGGTGGGGGQVAGAAQTVGPATNLGRAERGSVPPAPPTRCGGTDPFVPETLLLIGDKVVTAAPPAELYPQQLDLGAAWHHLTGLPFVFAVWMCRAGSDLGDLPALLDQTRRDNAQRLDAIVERHAEPLGWPRHLARQYLGQWLRFEVGPAQLLAIQRFWELCRKTGVLERLRPMRLYGATDRAPSHATGGRS